MDAWVWRLREGFLGLQVGSGGAGRWTMESFTCGVAFQDDGRNEGEGVSMRIVVVIAWNRYYRCMNADSLNRGYYGALI